MISKLAISNYRSIMDTTIPMGNLTLVTGANGTGKSNLYRALRLLSECANGSVVMPSQGKAASPPSSGLVLNWSESRRGTPM